MMKMRNKIGTMVTICALSALAAQGAKSLYWKTAGTTGSFHVAGNWIDLQDGTSPRAPTGGDAAYFCLAANPT